MKIVATVFALACLHIGVAKADDVIIPESVYIVAATADMLTTLDIKKHPELHETNAFLGYHPSDTKVVTYFATTTAIHALVTYEMVKHDVPSSVIKGWQYVTIGVELGYVASNLRLGLRFNF